MVRVVGWTRRKPPAKMGLQRSHPNRRLPMSAAARDLAALSTQPSDERLRALERIIPMSAVQEVLVQTGHARRRCRCLPHWFMVFYVIALGLFNDDSHTDVFKRLQRFRRGHTPPRNTIAEARKGLGIAPLRLLKAK